MPQTKKYSRRGFIKQGAALAAATVAAPMIVRSSVWGANDRVRVGYIGVGRRAGQLMNLPAADTTVTAYADVNMRRLEDLQQRNKDAKIFQDYREMLAADLVDAVVIATPDHWHALHAVHAMRAGKDVYVEKPMTLTIREGQIMVETAKEHGRICQVGSQQRSIDANRIACELLRNNVLGEIKAVHGSNYPSPWECPLPEGDAPDYINWDRWCGQTQLRGYHEELYLPRVRNHDAGWISYRPYSGGEMTGWGAHGLDQIQWALGVEESGPVEIWPDLDQVPSDDGEHKGPRCEVVYKFASGVEVRLDNKGPGGGALFECENGTLILDRGRYKTTPGKLGESDLPKDALRLYNSNDHAVEYRGSDTELHLANWIECIRTRQRPASDVQVGHHASILCHLGNIARWVERPLKWNPETERFVDDDEANTYLEREMRAPYTF